MTQDFTDAIVLIFAFLALPMGVVTLCSLIPWKRFDKKVKWHRWEYVLPALIVLSWFPFTLLKGGSLSNAVMNVAAAIAIALIVPWLRVILSKYSAANAALSAFVIAVAAFAVLAGIIFGAAPLPE